MAQALNLATQPGFTDVSRESQVVFRAVMDAMAHPTTKQSLPIALQPPAPLTPELAAVALALADHDAPIWLDDTLAANPAVAAYLRFHTGASVVTDPKDAAFALVADAAALRPLESFALGTEEYPDRSTTIVIAVEGFGGPDVLRVEGPGLASPGSLAPTPFPADFRKQVQDNHALFPRGVDLIFAAPGSVAALPRSSRLSEEG
jgi:alpha-D-ribose 1-methylphosphonate 5-triphosphate synthase subunit PhnH